MVRAGCAATTCAPPPRSSVLNPSRWRHHRNATPIRHSFTLRACRRQGRRVFSTQHRRFLIASGPILKIGLTHSQQTRKLFLIASFSSLFSDLDRITEPRSSLFALRPVLRFQKEDVVAFGVVEHGPGWAVRSALRFAAEYALASQSFHRGGKVGNLEKHDGLIGRRIIFRAFVFEAQEGVTGGESCVVARGFVGERESENIAVKFFRASKLAKVQLDAHHAGLCSFGHVLPPDAIVRRYGTSLSERVARRRRDPGVAHLWRRLNCSGGRAPSARGGSLTVARRSSKLLVSTGRVIRSSARAAINCEGEDRCRNALFSRMCGADIKSTGFASA
jgi:hypothetical protein